MHVFAPNGGYCSLPLVRCKTCLKLFSRIETACKSVAHPCSLDRIDVKPISKDPGKSLGN